MSQFYLTVIGTNGGHFVHKSLEYAIAHARNHARKHPGVSVKVLSTVEAAVVVLPDDLKETTSADVVLPAEFKSGRPKESTLHCGCRVSAGCDCD